MTIFLPIALGTLFGVSMVLFLLFLAAILLSRAIGGEVRRMRELPASPAPYVPADPASLPAPVARYLTVCGALDREPVKVARVLHGGGFSPSPDKPLHIEGMQYFSADPPGFVWWGRIRVAPWVYVDGRDSSIGGVGRMVVKAVGLFTVGDSAGERMDEGSLMRLLGELVWLPTALADSRYVRWTAMDDHAAAATITVGKVSATLIFRFGEDGFPLSVEGLRWRDLGGGNATLTPWYGLLSDYREVGGLKVPFALSANWLFDGRTFEYARWEVAKLEFDNPATW